MRQTIRLLMLAAAMIATATMTRQDAGASRYARLPQSGSDEARSHIAAGVSWPAPASSVAWTALTAYQPWREIKSYGSWPQSTFYGYSLQGWPNAIPSQPVSLELPSQVEPSRPALRTAPLEVQRQSSSRVLRIAFSAPVLAPMAHTRFCLAYPDECKVRKMVFRGGAIKLTAERRAELNKVNTEVNRAITFETNTEGLAAEKWLIAPKSGECHDYAVTKRHELIARGWPARVLLLAEVVVASGEHHLVLVVRTHKGDLVADNLNANIRDWSKTRYQWVRIQSPANPLYWATVARTTVYAQLR